jgi:hypothetical protein
VKSYSSFEYDFAAKVSPSHGLALIEEGRDDDLTVTGVACACYSKDAGGGARVEETHAPSKPSFAGREEQTASAIIIAGDDGGFPTRRQGDLKLPID